MFGSDRMFVFSLPLGKPTVGLLPSIVLMRRIMQSSHLADQDEKKPPGGGFLGSALNKLRLF